MAHFSCSTCTSRTAMSASQMHNVVQSSAVFKPDIFRGKVVFCTGGGTGICNRMVERLMQHGADAIIVGRRPQVIADAAKALAKATGRKCVGVSADVRDYSAMEAAVARGVKELGRIDFVICGAAGNFLAPIDGLSPNAFATVMQIDVIGTYNTMKATLAHVKQTKGSYISISATLHYSGTPLQAHVSAAKAGIDALSRVMAVEFGPHGIRSNIIAPGPIEGTEGMSRLATAERRKTVGQSAPVQRMGSLEDIANAGVFLFSPAASYITGIELVVDGGSWHTGGSGFGLPYPESVMDGANFREMIKSKL